MGILHAPGCKAGSQPRSHHIRTCSRKVCGACIGINFFPSWHTSDGTFGCVSCSTRNLAGEFTLDFVFRSKNDSKCVMILSKMTRIGCLIYSGNGCELIVKILRVGVLVASETGHGHIGPKGSGKFYCGWKRGELCSVRALTMISYIISRIQQYTIIFVSPHPFRWSLHVKASLWDIVTIHTKQLKSFVIGNFKCQFLIIIPFSSLVVDTVFALFVGPVCFSKL